jgi:S-formylglutathione hydrolase FrmB
MGIRPQNNSDNTPKSPQSQTPDTYYMPHKKFRVIYLYHGICGDHTEWVRGTMAEFSALGGDVALIIPDLGNSFGKNLKSGANYFDYLAYELPQIVQYHFPISDRYEDNCVAGLSMGGYAAFRTAFNCEKFGYTAGLSSVITPWHEERENGKDNGFVDIVLGYKNNQFCNIARPIT